MSTADWYAQRLGQARPAQPVVQQPVYPQMAPPPLVPPSQQPMQQFPQFQPTPQSKAQSASQTELCPSCGGENYLKVAANIATRCYDCGYPIEQSGSRYGSLTGARVEGPVRGATGNDTTNNYNPANIIGRIE